MKKLIIFLAIGIIISLWGCKTSFIQAPFCITLTNYVPGLSFPVYNPLTRTLNVSWGSAACATEYQLEWTFAGAEDSSIQAASWKPDFRFNSTRIVTPDTHYEIPVIYEEGTLIYRVRCVKVNDSTGQALFSSWSLVFAPGKNQGLTNLFLLARFEITSARAHENYKLNWQYTTKYSDGGARNDGVQYLDGTLRQRQLVTVTKSDTLALAVNTIYDNEGRAAIRTIPAPVIYADSLLLENQFAHHLGYFPKQVLASRDTIFTYRQFDLDRYSVKSDSCSPAILKPQPLSIESGASRYYSTNNQDKAGFQGFVPDAGGFPYLQTQWTDDNTNRVTRQSAPGQTHFIGSNHELSLRYADVAQDELDILFGNDAGNENYYKKIIKVNPNGQISIEYTRVDGKIVATALAGPVPGNIDSIGTQIMPINVDIVGTQQTVAADGLSKFSSKTFDLSINTACAFGYRLLPENFEKTLCSNEKVCLDCKYKVQLILKDQNGTVLHQIDTVIGTLSQNCATGASSYRTLFTKILCKGNYTISRTLTIDTSGFETYYQSYLKKADSCGDQSVIFPIPEKITSTCNLTCDECNTLPDSLKGGLKQYCDFICNKGFASPCEQSKLMMLINVSPGGQYAQFDKVLGNVDASKYPLSIFRDEKWRTLTSPAPASLKQYLINNDLHGLVNNWQPAWAEYFLPLHPEYCYYRFCVDNENAYIQSKQFNDRMLGITNAQSAVGTVYIDAGNNDASLNTFGIAAEVKARLNNFRNGKNLKEFIYTGFVNCKFVPPYNNNFANTPDTFANNMQWQMYRALYMSIKNQVIDSLREVFVTNKCGGLCNKCIGDTLNHYSSCNIPNCNIPVDSICNALRKKSRLFASSFSFQEQLPFKLTGVDSLDLAIIQNYTAKQLPKNCRCAKYDQIESIFRYVVGKKTFVGSTLIPDTLCSVGIPYETIAGYRGDLRWVGTVQTAGQLRVDLYDTMRNKRCEMNFITVDSLIPWSRIVLTSCLRANRLPSKFPTGPNVFLLDLYDSTYKKYTAEATISCIDTSSCKTATTCKPACDENGLEHILNCGFSNGNSSTIDLKDSIIKKWLECTYNTKLGKGKITWRGVRSGSQYIVTISINAEIKGLKKNRLIDSCQYIFDFGMNIGYAGSKMEVISIEPDRRNSKDTCKIYGMKMILKIQTENLPPKYITVYGRPTKDCFLIAECCKVELPKKCPNEFSNVLSTFNSINKDTVTARLGFADTSWSKKFSLINSGYYYFSFNVRATARKGIPPSSMNATLMLQQFELRIDDSIYTQNLQIQPAGNNQYLIKGRIPFKFKRQHRLQLELKSASNTVRQFTIRAYNFSLVGENCDDCCFPVFPPFGTPDPGECDSTKKIVDGYNGQIIRTQYLAELRAKLKFEFIQHCLSNIDSFKLKYSDALYHFTLFYYDQANNLVSTIPPKGVRLLPADSVQKVQLHRTNGAAPAIYPAHAFRTEYRLNSINAVVQNITPDAGASRNWYDPVGRLIVRQEARQAPLAKYSYTLYDRLSRIVQSGEFVRPGANIPSLVNDSVLLVSALRSSIRYDVNTTFYDQPLVDSINGLTSMFRNKNKFYGDSLNYLRHRVATTTYNDSIPAASNLAMMNYEHAIHYWYDMHGFVRMLIHEIPALKSYSQNFKREAYDYELLSGLVKKVKYQQGEADQFFTRYELDADNRLKGVFTSLNDTAWVRDARYYYNKHRLLARIELGADTVQGLDYVYTIQGLTKSINSFGLRTELDPGRDGDSSGSRRSSAIDMFGYEIGYFRNDYKPINPLLIGSGIHLSLFDSLRINDGLYDGNIRYVVKGLQVPLLAEKIQSSVYSYDQGNRLTGSVISPITIEPGYVAKAGISADYATRMRYDGNGNVIAMLRNGAAAAGQRAMDVFSFHYNSLNNQLQFITDTVNASSYNNDIDGSQPGNYKYDASGNITKDVAENLDTILWNSRAKIARIVKDGGATSIGYTYNSLGNRFTASVNGTTTYYITDAKGNILATYKKDSSGLRCNELMIYGSKRLGVFDKNLNGANPGFVKGNKQYELNDHLGNVLVTVSDKKIPHDPDGNGIVNYYSAEIVSASDYYPFGMHMPLRTVSDTAYRYGFNGKEKDDNVKGPGNQLDFGSRIYDSRLGRFLSIDPAAGAYPYLSPYVSSANNPILYIDKYGEGPEPAPPEIEKAIKDANPAGFAALKGANNTSTADFYDWVINKGGDSRFYTFKGVFGEAELHDRVTKGKPHMHEEGLSIPVKRAYFGEYFNRQQVDLQQFTTTLHIPGLIDRSADLHTSNLYGNPKYEVLGKDANVTIIVNYEAKTISPQNQPESNYQMLVKGVEQAIARTSEKKNAVGVLVTEREAWMNLLTHSAYTEKVQKLYDKLTKGGGRLILLTNYEQTALLKMWITYEAVKKAEEDRKKKKRDDD